MRNNSILSGRFSPLTKREGDLMKNLDSPGKTRRVGKYESHKWKLHALG